MASVTAEGTSGSEARRASQRRESQTAAGGGPTDIHRLSRSGNSLYELLDLPKESTNDDIRRKYRRLALKYHPDKNPDNPEAEEMFKKINQAHSILTDEKKRELYDKYGSFGLYISDTFGEEVVEHIMMFSSGWFRCLFASCFFLSGCCCCFCCLCCCFGCCGKCKPDVEDEDLPDVGDLEGEETNASDEPHTAQPTAAEASADLSAKETSATATVIDVDERTALNGKDKVGYTPDMTETTTPKKVPDS